MRVAPVIWQFGVDYPGAEGDDAKLPIRDVLIKAFDATYWMGTFDKHDAAVTGPAQIAKLVAAYKAQGIGVYLWCVPKGRNVSAQLRLAKACLDVTGVKGLYMDVEPYAGFCNADCTYLADTFMAQLRAARPKKYLGVIYDPRPQHWDRSGLPRWLKHADAAAPMCYWVTFRGQGVWEGAASSVHQAAQDLRQHLGFKGAYTPMLQGSASGSDLQQAAQQANTDGAAMVTLWRRGVVTASGWDSLRSVPSPTPPATSDCSELEAALVACKDHVETLKGRVERREAKIAFLRETIERLEATLATKDTRLMELEPAATAWRRAQRAFRSLVEGHEE